MKFINKELIIFDLDGTLIDSVPDLSNAVNHTLKSLDRDVFSQDIVRRWVGNGAQILVKRALCGDVIIDENIDEELFKKAMEIFLDFYSLNLSVETILYPEVKNTLLSLKSKGYRLAIITNKPYSFIKPILETFELIDIFEEYLGGDSLDLKKPNPLPLLHLCEKLNIDTQKALMVGDSKNDIIAANGANIESIAVTYGYNYDEDISIHNPTLIFNEFSKIDQVL